MNTKHLFHKIIGQGPDLVLVHGWGFNSDIWRSLLPEMQSHFTVHLIDLPGFGRSHGNYNYQFLAHILDEIIPILPEKANYLGWSLGGLILYALAKKIPEQMKTLFFVGSTPCFIKKTGWPGLNLENFQTFLQALETDHEARWKRFICEHLKNRLLIKTFFDKGCPTYLTLSSAIHFLIESDYRDFQKKLNIPQYYFFGGQDDMVPNEIVKALNNNVGKAILPDAKHTSFLSHKAPFITHLHHFLKNTSRK